MAKLSFGNIELSVRSAASQAVRPSDETPFRILVLGDFSGRTNRQIVERLGSRRPMAVDCDNLETLLARLRPELKLPLGEAGTQTVTFSALDDFHPDTLFARLPLFAKLQEPTLA